MTDHDDRLGAVLGAGAAAVPALDPPRVLAAARRRRQQRRAIFGAGAAAAAVVAITLAVAVGGTPLDDAAPVAPTPSSTEPADPSPRPTEQPEPSIPSPSAASSSDYAGLRFVLVNGQVCDGEIVCFQVLDRDALAPGGLLCEVGPREVGPTPALTPDRALPDGTPVQVVPEEDRLQGYVGDRFFVLHGLRDLTEAQYRAGTTCAQAPPLEQVRAFTTVWVPDGPYPQDDQEADADLLRRLVAFAADPGTDPATVPFAPEVVTGLPEVVEPVPDTADRTSWPVPQVLGDRGSVLEQLARLAPGADPTSWSSQDGRTWRMVNRIAPACGAQLLPVSPTIMTGYRPISLATFDDASCLDAGSLTVYVDQQDRVVGVVEAIWEP